MSLKPAPPVSLSSLPVGALFRFFRDGPPYRLVRKAGEKDNKTWIQREREPGSPAISFVSRPETVPFEDSLVHPLPTG